MHINLFLIPFVILFGLLMGANDTRQHRKWYIILCSAVLLFVAAMRSPEWMTNIYRIDTLVYKYHFEESFDMKWDEFWSAVVGRYVGLNDEYDIGFIGLQKIIGFFTHDFHVYSLIVDLLFFVPFGIILYRYTTSTKQIIFAFVFYIALIQIHLIGGGRQMFALGFDIIALIAMIDKKKLWSAVFILLAISIHFSSILFLVPLLMIWYNLSPATLKMSHLGAFLVIPFAFLFPNQLIVFMGEASGLEKYAVYGKDVQGGANTFIFLIEMLSLFCLVAIKQKDILCSKTLQFFYVMTPLFTLFAPLIRGNGVMIRVTMYYSIFLTVLVPYAIECMFKKNEKTIAYVITIGALAFLTISGGGMRYYFYWQV